jgi:hypothetical protein
MKTQGEHIRTLRRRVDFLKTRDYKNSYDQAELGALEWALVNLPPAHDVDRLVELARADERMAMMQLFTDPENQPTQHGTVTLEYMQREIADEREACAKEAESWDCHLAAAEIRARSNT